MTGYETLLAWAAYNASRGLFDFGPDGFPFHSLEGFEREAWLNVAKAVLDTAARFPAVSPPKEALISPDPRKFDAHEGAATISCLDHKSASQCLALADMPTGSSAWVCVDRVKELVPIAVGLAAE